MSLETTQPDRLAALQRLGFSEKEAQRYLALDASSGDTRLRMLRARRRALLDDIHTKQGVLDNIDFLIWELKKGARVKQ